MATFVIHEDEALKENACVPRLIESKQQTLLQQQRKTFGVLNNAQLGARAHAQKTVIFQHHKTQHHTPYIYLYSILRNHNLTPLALYELYFWD